MQVIERDVWHIQNQDGIREPWGDVSAERGYNGCSHPSCLTRAGRNGEACPSERERDGEDCLLWRKLK